MDEFQKAYGRETKASALYGYFTARYILEGYKKAGAIVTMSGADAAPDMK